MSEDTKVATRALTTIATAAKSEPVESVNHGGVDAAPSMQSPIEPGQGDAYVRAPMKTLRVHAAAMQGETAVEGALRLATRNLAKGPRSITNVACAHLAKAAQGRLNSVAMGHLVEISDTLDLSEQVRPTFAAEYAEHFSRDELARMNELLGDHPDVEQLEQAFIFEVGLARARHASGVPNAQSRLFLARPPASRMTCEFASAILDEESYRAVAGEGALPYEIALECFAAKVEDAHSAAQLQNDGVWARSPLRARYRKVFSSAYGEALDLAINAVVTELGRRLGHE